MLFSEASRTVTQPFLHGQLSFSSRVSPHGRLLDTLDHFDYDSACTMILNLEAHRVGRRILLASDTD